MPGPSGICFSRGARQYRAMKRIPSGTDLLRLVMFCTLFPGFDAAWGQLRLGDPPVAPTDISSLPKVTRSATLVYGGFSVNTGSRETVRSFYNAVYKASEDVPISSTADIANCVPGTTSQDFKDAVLRRINWYRAMAGVPASVVLNELNNTKDQQAALMMSRNDQLSHTPPNTWACWTSEGYEAAGNSNIGIGSNGPDTVNGYIRDHGSGNYVVGHRRWLLYPQTQVMGTGDVPAQNGYYEANAVWVIDGHYTDSRPSTRTPFVAWPPAGYVPKQTVFPRWSLSYPGANFTTATVNMLSNGVPVSVSLETPANGYGENTLVWVPMGLDSSSSTSTWPFNGQDTVYSVSVGNVTINTTTTNFSYTVTVFDPAVPGPDYSPLIISGPAAPSVGYQNLYTFTAVTNATSYQWRQMQKIPFALTDGAEAGLVNFTTSTGPYSVINSSPVASGSYAFQLGHVSGALTPQLLTLNTTLLALTNTSLSFKSQLKAATADQVARVQLSVNDGDWFDIYSQPGTDWPGESTWTLHSIALGSYASSAVRVRFNYDFSFGSYYPGADAVTGWHLDDIAISNAAQGVQAVTNSVASTQFQFTPSQAAEYSLQARALIYTDFPLEWGPAKDVTAVNSAPPAIRSQSISVSNGTARITFAVTSGSATSFKLLQAGQVTGVWTTNTAALLTTNIAGSSFQFTVPAQSSVQFYRIQTP